MSQLKAHEKVIIERLFDRSGYVLNFSDRTFAEFFREHKINIDADKYRFNGNSKMKRLRAFWEIESDPLVGRVLESLLQYACAIEQVDEGDQKKALDIVYRLQGKKSTSAQKPNTEENFIKKRFSEVDWNKLNLDVQLQPVILQRIDEIQKSLNSGIALATIFLCGSTLEGLLQDAATKNPQLFNQASASPKDKLGNVRQLQDWTLDALINVAHEVGMLSLDVKKHSHSLKDFRNYIHPRQQAVHQFQPDMHTAKISWQVLQAAIAGLCGQRK